MFPTLDDGGSDPLYTAMGGLTAEMDKDDTEIASTSLKFAIMIRLLFSA